MTTERHRPQARTAPLRTPLGGGCARLQLIAHSLQQRPGCADAVGLAQAFAFVFNADAPAITGVADDLHHAAIIDDRLLAALIEIVTLGAHALGEGHEFRHALVAVVLVVRAIGLAEHPEVAEVRQRATARMVNGLDYARQPL